jgi:hypothetical protein
MICAAHQPCYLPSIPFFLKMKQADVFILVDDFAFTKHHTINRALVKCVTGVQWLTVPVFSKGHLGQLINQVKIVTSRNWQRRHFKTLQVNYTYSPWFEKYGRFFEETYAAEWQNLVDLNLHLIEFMRRSFRIQTKLVLSTSLALETKGHQRLIEMIEKVDCQKFIAETSYADYLNKDIFAQNGCALGFITNEHSVYYQQFDGFVKDVSAVDLLFNEGGHGLDQITVE